jgi:thiol-disulfide isomerase/thioredoxin
MPDKTIKWYQSSKWRNRAVNVVLFIIAFSAIRMWQQRDMIKGMAPDLRGMTLTGQPYILPVHPGHPVLVQFWATWCPICRAEQDSIAALAKKYDVMTIAMQSGKEEEVVHYLNKQGVQFPVINDANGGITNAWGVHAVPVSFIIAADRRIRFIEVGYTTKVGLESRLWLAGMY